MTTYAEDVETTISSAIAATTNATEDVQKAAVAAAVASMPPPPPPVVGVLWKSLVWGLLAVLLISLIGIVFTVLDKDANTSSDVLVTVFTAALTGLLGLFVKSP
jgi:hypothetical protein